MDWSLNDAQKQVLGWLAGGQDGDPPREAWKQSVSSLKSRGLATTTRKGGVYRADVTPAGRFFHEHGTYPDGSAGARWAPDGLVEQKVRDSRAADRIHTAAAQAADVTRPTVKGRPSRKPAGLATGPASSEPVTRIPGGRPGTRATKPKVEPSPPPPGDPVRITKPHPAVKSLMAHPVALPKDPEHRRRGFVAAHRLVQAAQEHGFTIVGHVQPATRSGGRGSSYLGELLVTLDAGDRPVEVRIGEYSKRVAHVKTDKEKADEARGRWSWVPRWDWHDTGVLFFRVYGYGSSTRVLENSRTPLADRVAQVIDMVRDASDAAVRAEEHRRQWEAERRAREEAQRLLAEQREHYERWERILLDLHNDWRKATDVRALVQALRSHAGSDPDLTVFLDWADLYADMLDPTRTVRLPTGKVPDLSHEERLKYGRPEKSAWQRPTFGW